MQKDKKTIGIIIRFFTNDLPKRVGERAEKIPFWTCGNVHLEANQMKKIKPPGKTGFLNRENSSLLIYIIHTKHKGNLLSGIGVQGIGGSKPPALAISFLQTSGVFSLFA